MGQLQHVRGGAQRREQDCATRGSASRGIRPSRGSFPQGLFHLLALGDVHAPTTRRAPEGSRTTLPRLSTQRTAPSARDAVLEVLLLALRIRHRRAHVRARPDGSAARRPRTSQGVQAVDRLHLARPRKALRAEIQFPAPHAPGVGATCSRSSRSRIASTDRCGVCASRAISSIGATLGTGRRSPRPMACVALASDAIGASAPSMNHASAIARASATATPVAVSRRCARRPGSPSRPVGHAERPAAQLEVTYGCRFPCPRACCRGTSLRAPARAPRGSFRSGRAGSDRRNAHDDVQLGRPAPAMIRPAASARDFRERLEPQRGRKHVPNLALISHRDANPHVHAHRAASRCVPHGTTFAPPRTTGRRRRTERARRTAGWRRGAASCPGW